MVIVDEFTGRLMPGRRWSDGLHQAVEAKENVKIESENQTLATITFQNYFRMYKKLVGHDRHGRHRSGRVPAKSTTSKSWSIPTNQPMIRIDNHDVVYKTEDEKFDAVIEEIQDCHERGQPVLVGTVSIEKSERVANQLKKTGVKHYVLNAKNHEREAEIVAQAGRLRRGHDLDQHGGPRHRYRARRQSRVLAAAEAGTRDPDDPKFPGGAREVSRPMRAPSASRCSRRAACTSSAPSATNRAASTTSCAAVRDARAIPGSSRFYLSLEDDLLRIFGADRLKGLMGRIGMEDGVPIEHRWISQAIENAQKKVEAHNFDIRKHLLEYDDVMNRQREVVYHRRRELLSGAPLKDDILDMCDELIEEIVEAHADTDEGSGGMGLEGDRGRVLQAIQVPSQFPRKRQRHASSIMPDDLIEIASERVRALYDQRETGVHRRR